MVTTSKKNPPTFGCFSNLFVKFISKSNLPIPTHPPFLNDDEIPEQTETDDDNINKNDNDNDNDNDNENDVDVVVETQQSNPGIVARLMGLETMPISTATHESSSSSSSVIYRRSRSLNSLHFFPDFDPARAAFHRRNQTSSSASFHEQAHNHNHNHNHSHDFVVKVEEYSAETNSPMKTTELKSGQDESTKPKQPEKRENINVVKNNRRNEERYDRSNNRLKGNENVGMQRRHNKAVNAMKNNKDRNNNNNNNVKVGGGSGSNVSRRKIKKTKKKDVEDNVEVVDHQSEVSTRSPVSVLDLHHLEFDSPSPAAAADDAKVKPTTSTSRKSSARRIKLVDDDPTPQKTTLKSNINDEDPTSKGESQQKSVKDEDNAEVVAEYFMGFSDQVFGNAEAQLRKDMTSDIRRYELFKAQFIEDLCMDLGQEIVEYLLYELTHELINN